MNTVLKANLLFLIAFNSFFLSTAGFSSNVIQSNFRSAKKIPGASTASSKDSRVRSPSASSSWKTAQRIATTPTSSSTKRYQSSSSSSESSSDGLDDDEKVEPGKMRISEIKAELDLREISYADCFDKESLVKRLEDARAAGIANPKILEKFNKQKMEEIFDPEKKVEIKDEDINSAVANDGTLPGGLTPDQFKKLTSNPEIMSLLQSTKMQEAMTLMMTGGRDELEKKLRDDPELQETVAKLDSIMKGALS